MKKQRIYMLTIIIILLVSFTTSAVEIKDVPGDHWAYNSVKTLIEKGYLSLYDDGTFSGNNKVTRYELAELVARILHNLQTGKTAGSEQDVDTLRKLSLELRDELVEIATDQNIFTSQLNQVKETNIIQNEDVARVNERLTGIEADVTRIIDNILQLKQLQDEVQALKVEVADLKVQLDKNNQDLKEQLNEGLFKDAQDQQAVTQTRIHTLQGKVSELEKNLAQNQSEIKKLEKKNDNYTLYLAAVALLAVLMK